MTPGLAASAETPGKATPPTSAAGRRLSALLQCKSVLGSPSPCPRPRTSAPRVVFTGSEFASSTRTNCGSEASPGTPLALDLLSPQGHLATGRGQWAASPWPFPQMQLPEQLASQVSPLLLHSRDLRAALQLLHCPEQLAAAPGGSLLEDKVSGHTPTAPFAEPAVSVHGVVSAPEPGIQSQPLLA